MQFAVGVVGVVIDIRYVCCRERTVRAEVRELVEVCKAVEQSLVASARETSDGTVVAVVDSAIVLFNIRHEVVHEVVAEHVASELCLR